MAYQPKSYRKFVATAATATLVATAFAPFASAHSFKDVETKYNDAVDFLVSKGIQGLADGTFGTQQNIKRVDAAMMLGKALGLDKVTDSPASGFTDVPARAVTIVNTFKAKGITSGKTATTFGANDLITRDELAVWIFKAFDLKAKDGSTNKFTDVADNYKAAVQALVDNGITAGTTETTFGSKNNAKRGDFALFIKRAVDATAELTVAGVSAVNGTTLSLTGTALGKLTAEDIKLEGNTVVSITAAADGKSATVKFNNAFLLDTKYTVEIKDSVSTKTFDFSYGLAVTSVEVVEATIDNDTLNQTVAIKVNGQPVDYDALAVAGYTVDFVAVDSSNVAVPGFFKVSTLGLVADTNAVDNYVVEVTIRKGGDIIVSDKGTVKVRNLELVTSSIKSEELVNTGGNNVSVQNSRTLVTGETLVLNKITNVSNGAERDVAYSSGDVTVLTSNPAVISVDPRTGELKANTPGTADITFIYGDVEKKVSYTVTNTARKVTKATPTSTSGTIIAGKSVGFYVAAVDQYGDFLGNQAITVELPATGITTASTATITTETSTNTGVTPAQLAGRGYLTVSGVAGKKGSGTILFKDSTGKTIGSYGVKVTDIDNVATTKLELVGKPTNPAYSTDNALDLAADGKLEYALNKYTSEGVYNGTDDLAAGNYTVTYNADIITIGSVATGVQNKVAIPGTNLEIAAKAVGSTDVAVYAENGTLVSKFRVTVSDTGYAIKSISYKSVPTIDYAGKNISVSDVLTLVASDKDDIVKGITLNKALSHVIRLDDVTAELYIDADGNGDKDTGELVLGTVEAEVVTGATGGLAVGAFDIFTGKTTAASNKGTLVFKVVGSNSTILSSTSVTVKVN